MTLEVERPRVSSERWMGCQHTEEEIESIQKLARIQNETSAAPSVNATIAPVFKLLFLSFAIGFVFSKFWVRFHSFDRHKHSTAIDVTKRAY